jgi:hypothetical protein
MRRALEVVRVALWLALLALGVVALTGHAGNQHEGSAIPWLVAGGVIVTLLAIISVARGRRG